VWIEYQEAEFLINVTLLVGGRDFQLYTTHGAVFFLYTIIISIVIFE
jgi:hypothetical protein